MQGMSFLNKAAFVVLLALICVAVGVSVVPQWKKLQELENDLATTLEQEEGILDTADQRRRELQAMRENEEFRELQARDLLDLYHPGETVVRIRRN